MVKCIVGVEKQMKCKDAFSKLRVKSYEDKVVLKELSPKDWEKISKAIEEYREMKASIANKEWMLILRRLLND